MSLAEQLAMLCTVAGLIAGGLALATVHSVRVAVRVALELWTAAALLRLAEATTWPALATAAAVIAVRQLAVHGLTSADLVRRQPRSTPAGKG